MNERMRDLFHALIWKASIGYNDSWSQVDPEVLEKFAELIVRECINEIHVADVGDLKGKGYYLDKVAEHIEKHFGVENA